MPQLDLLTYPSQWFWLGVTFTLFYYVTARLIVPKIDHVLQTRAAHINHHIQQAEELQKKAEKLQKQQEDMLSQAHDKAQAILQEQAAVWNAKEEEHKEKRQQELKQQLEQSQQTIASSHRAAMEQLEQVSLPLLKSMLHHSAHMAVDDDQLQKAIQESAKSWKM